MPCSLAAAEHMKPRPKTVLPAPHVPLRSTRSFSGIPLAIRLSNPGIPALILFIKTFTYDLGKLLWIAFVELQISGRFLHVVHVPLCHPFQKHLALGYVPKHGIYRNAFFGGYLVKYPRVAPVFKTVLGRQPDKGFGHPRPARDRVHAFKLRNLL